MKIGKLISNWIYKLFLNFSACRRSREETERDGDEEVHGIGRPIRNSHSGKTFITFWLDQLVFWLDQLVLKWILEWENDENKRKRGLEKPIFEKEEGF